MDMSGHGEFARASALGLRKVMPYPVVIDACLRSSAAGSIKVQLTDISETGCQCKKLARLAVGSYLTLVMPNLAPFGATVVWVADEQIGLQFNTKLHISVVDHVVSLSSAHKTC